MEPRDRRQWYDLQPGTDPSALTLAATRIAQHPTLVTYTPPLLAEETIYYWQCRFARGDEDSDVPAVPPCPRCGAPLRPGVVWFDEDLEPRDEHRVEDFLKQGPCDVALVIGTSAGFDYIVDWAERAAGTTGQLVEINPEATPLSAKAGRTIRERASVETTRARASVNSA